MSIDHNGIAHYSFIVGLYSRIIFPKICQLACGVETLTPYRKKVLSCARGETLEIGIGTGLNFRHYPKTVSSVVGIERNQGMQKYLVQAMGQCLVPAKVVQGTVLEIPFRDHSFDTVVSTFTLCSIEDVLAALREIKRVMKPDGRLLFFEHGLSPEPSVQRWQYRINGIQKFFADGCQLVRRFDELFPLVGLKPSRLDRFYLPDTPKTHGAIYEGSCNR